MIRSTKERPEDTVRRSGMFSLQWPKESNEFVKGIREKVDEIGFDKKTFFSKIRPTMVGGKVYILADV
jgi:hypothetical protein